MARQRAKELLDTAGIVVTADEMAHMEVAECNLGMLEEIGLQIIVYINTERVCAKELVMFPGQTAAEHRHPPRSQDPGKQETFRCRWGEAYLYVPGKPVSNPRATIPSERKKHFTVWHEIILRPGDQYTIPPDTLHWFQAGKKGVVISEFSTTSIDKLDLFTDPEIQRVRG